MLAYRCGEFLDLLHIPSILAQTLADKLTNSRVGFDENFKVTEVEGRQRLVATTDLNAFNDIWIIPHCHTTTRSKLYKELEEEKLRAEILAAIHLPLDTSFPTNHKASSDLCLHTELEDAFEEYWSWCFPSTMGLDENLGYEELQWHLEAPDLLCIPHADSPNAIVRPLPAVLYETLPEFSKGASILCLITSVQAGRMLKRNILPRKRTRNRISKLNALIGDSPDRWAHDSERQGVKQLNDCSSPITSSKFEVAIPNTEKSDIRPMAAMTEFIPSTHKVFSDYPSVVQFLTHPAFELVAEFENSDILFAVSPVASFNSLGKRLVNQFQKEAHLICPRMLVHSIRTDHLGQREGKPSSIVVEADTNPLDLLPEWFPTSFDLKTEIKLFLETVEKMDNPYWLLISGEAGLPDWCVTRSIKTIVKFTEANDGNWVAQRLNTDPFLYTERKLLVSTYLLVYSFDPVDGYLYNKPYGTVANKHYSLKGEFLADEEVQLPFADPDQTCERARLVKVLTSETLKEVLEGSGADWGDFIRSMVAIAKKIMQSVQLQIGPTQTSRAVYRLDFRLPSFRSDLDFQPELARVEFAPDFTIPCQTNPQLVNQIFELLFLDGELPSHFIELREEKFVTDSEISDLNE